MDTSGVLLIAKSEVICAHLNAQFRNHSATHDDDKVKECDNDEVVEEEDDNDDGGVGKKEAIGGAGNKRKRECEEGSRIQDTSPSPLQKTYIALCYGHIDPALTRISLPLSAHPTRALLQRVDHTQTGKASITLVSNVKHSICPVTQHAVSTVQLQPLTGRTHQLRVHLHDIGHPILGDKLYYNEEAGSDSMGGGRLCLHAQQIQLIHPHSGEVMVIKSSGASFLQ